MRWELGISTGIGYRQPFAEALGPVRGAGMRLIEVCTAPEHLDLRRLERIPAIRAEIDRLGLEVRSLHAPFGPHVDLTNADPEVRRRSLDQVERSADALRMLGGRILVIHPGSEDNGWVWQRDRQLTQSVESLNRVFGLCQERDLSLAVETPLPHLLGGQLNDLDWILARLPAAATICLDTSHTSLGGTLFDAIGRFGARIAHVQASDNRGVTDDHLPPGEGNIDWERVFNCLRNVDYRGAVVLEIAGNGDVAANVAHARATVRSLCPSLWPGEDAAPPEAGRSPSVPTGGREVGAGP